MTGVKSTATYQFKRPEIEERTRATILKVMQKTVALRKADSFVSVLGFNSLRMVSLSLALEEEFGSQLLLNDWIASADDPRDLTVGSLYDYVEKALADGLNA